MPTRPKRPPGYVPKPVSHRYLRAPTQYGCKKTPMNMQRVLEELARGGSPRSAAAAIGACRETIYEWKKKDPEFDAAWSAALEEGTDRLEEEARRRAEDGWTNPVFQGGEQVGEVRNFSDPLMMMLLKGKRPDVYNTDRLEITGRNRGPITSVTVGMSVKEAAEAYATTLLGSSIVRQIESDKK